MLLTALPRDLSATVVMILELDPRNPLTFKYGKCRKHVLYISATGDTLALLDLEGACTVV